MYIKYILASYIQLLIKLTYLAIYYRLSASYLSIIIVTINIYYGRELSNLATIYINNIKYNKQNNNFIFKLTNIYNIFLRANILSKVKIKTSLIMLKDQTLNNYYSNINTSIITINFNQICNFDKNYLKKAKYKQNIFLQ